MATRLITVALLTALAAAAQGEPAPPHKQPAPSPTPHPASTGPRPIPQEVPAQPPIEPAAPSAGSGAGSGSAAGEATQVAPEPNAKAEKIRQDFRSESTLQGASITSEVLQVVAQVVVDRAMQAGWDILSEQLQDSLDCDQSTTPYAKTCDVLKKVEVQDVLASPTVLLEAAVQDFASIWYTRLHDKISANPSLKIATEVTIGAAGFATLWGQNSKDTAVHMISDRVSREIANVVADACPTTDEKSPFDLPSTRALWAIGTCLIDTDKDKATGATINGIANKLKVCDLTAKLGLCFPKAEVDDATLAAAQRLRAALTSTSAADIADGTMGFVVDGAANRMKERNGKEKTRDTACFAATDKKFDTDLCYSLIEHVGSVANGLIRQDWNKVTVGVVGTIQDYGALKGEKVSGTRFYTLLTSIGQYALTYTKPDPTDPSGTSKGTDAANKSRRDIIENLIKSTVNRNQRSGWVWSLGGSFGLGGMYRHGIGEDTSGWSGPFILPLGLGLDWYPIAHSVGPHFQVGIFDLGQYVTFEDNHMVTVGTPDAKAAVAFSASAGLWFGPRNTPLFVGPYGGVAPFVLKSGHPEYFIGAMVAAYIPIFDF